LLREQLLGNKLRQVEGRCVAVAAAVALAQAIVAVAAAVAVAL
jgi:hypothetical protein